MRSLKKKSGLVILFLSVVLVVGCARVHYIGNMFNPTEEIDIYYSLQDVKQEFTVMGHAVGSGSTFVPLRKIQGKLIQEAKLSGADAIVFNEVERSHFPFGSDDDERFVKASFIKYL